MTEDTNTGDHVSVKIKTEELVVAAADLSLAAHAASAVVLASDADEAKENMIVFSECLNSVFSHFGWMITQETWEAIKNSKRREFMDVISAREDAGEVPS